MTRGVLARIVALGCLYGAAAATLAPALARSEPMDALLPTPIVCLFKAHGGCKPHRLVGTIAAWTSIQQCGIVSALSEPPARPEAPTPSTRRELRTRPGLCEFFGAASGTARTL